MIVTAYLVASTLVMLLLSMAIQDRGIANVATRILCSLCFLLGLLALMEHSGYIVKADKIAEAKK